MARPRKIIDAFFVSRPVLWIPVWGFAAFGYWRGSGGSSLGDIARAFRTLKWEAFGWMLCFSASVGAVYALNQIADRDTDSRNGGFALLVHGGVSNRTACISAAILAGVSILVPLAFQPLISLLAAGSLLLGIVYSFPPCRFSGRPVLDFLSNAVGYGVIAFAAGWHLAGAALATPSFAVSTVPYFLLMCGGSISSTLPDIPGDIVDGKRTTAVAIGERRGRLVATGFIVAAAVAAYWLRDAVALGCSLVPMPLYGAHILLKNPWVMEATYKVGGGVAMLVAGLVFPPMIPAAITVGIVTRVYFRTRFGVSYPCLVPDSPGGADA